MEEQNMLQTQQKEAGKEDFATKYDTGTQNESWFMQPISEIEPQGTMPAKPVYQPVSYFGGPQVGQYPVYPNMHMPYSQQIMPQFRLTPTIQEERPEEGRLLLRVTGERMNPFQFQRTVKKQNRWLIPMVIVLFLFLGIAAVDGDGTIWTVNDNIIALWVLGAGIIAAAGLLIRKTRVKNSATAKSMVYINTFQGRVITEFYLEKAVQISENGQTEIVYEDDTEFIQTYDMLYIRKDSDIIAVRAEDITAEDAQQVYDAVYPYIQPEQRKAEQDFIPRYREESAVMTQPPEWKKAEKWIEIPIPEERDTQLQKRLSKLAELLPVLTGMTMIIGALTAVEIDLMPYFALNLLLQTGLLWIILMMFAAAGALMPLFREIREKDLPEGMITITNRGLTVRENGTEYFFDPQTVRGVEKGEAIVIKTPLGNYKVLWDDIPEEPDRELLRKLLINK